MKILCLNGSPRKKGNTAKIAERFCETAEILGSEVKIVALRKLKYQGCTACGACKKKSEKCVLKDDLSVILKKMDKYDVVVFGSPVYYGDLCSQMKAFIDRTYSYLTSDYKSRLTPGKTLVMILPQGDTDEKHFADIFPRYFEFFKWYGFKDGYSIRACGADEKDGKTMEKALKEAEELAAKISMAK